MLEAPWDAAGLALEEEGLVVAICAYEEVEGFAALVEVPLFLDWSGASEAMLAIACSLDAIENAWS